jgi:hypothetical protein
MKKDNHADPVAAEKKSKWQSKPRAQKQLIDGAGSRLDTAFRNEASGRLFDPLMSESQHQRLRWFGSFLEEAGVHLVEHSHFAGWQAAPASETGRRLVLGEDL